MPQKSVLKLSVFSDYICPFCYIGSRRVLRLGEEYDLKVNWCGLEIHPDTPATGVPVEDLGYEPQRWREMMDALKAMAAEERIPLVEHSFTTNSRKALLLAEAAKQAGREVFYALHERLFSAFFCEGRNIGDEQVLRSLADETNVPGELVEAAWTEPQYGERLTFNLRSAVELNIGGTPAYVFGRRLVTGAVPYAQLAGAAAELSAAEPD